MSTVTPSMSLIIPDVGDSSYPSSIESSLTTLDTHTHASGSGVQIPTGGIADLAVTTGKLAANAVTTAKITDANVTKAKLAAVGQQSGSGAGFVTTSSTAVDVTGVTATITSTGRPIMVLVHGLYAAERSSADTQVKATFAVLRDATSIGAYDVLVRGLVSQINNRIDGPVSFAILDAPAAGTYTYKLQVVADPFDTNTSVSVGSITKITVFEL